MFCHNCGYEIKKGHKFCTECGTAVENDHSKKQTEMMVCKACGGTMRITDDRSAMKCPYCGSAEILEVSDEVELARIRKEIEIARMRHEKEKRILEEELKIKKERADGKNFLFSMIGILLLPVILFKIIIPIISPSENIEEKVYEETVLQEKEEFNGYGIYENRTLQVGDFIFYIPEYWGNENVIEKEGKEIHQLYAEYDEDVMLQIYLRYDDEDPVSYEMLVDWKDLMIPSIENSYGDGNAEFYKDIITDYGVKGLMYKFDGELSTFFSSRDVSGLYSVFPSESDNCWLYVELVTDNDSKYIYNNDYLQIIQNLKYEPVVSETTKETSGQPVNEKVSNSDIVDASKEETVTEITQDSILFKQMLEMDYDELYEFAKKYHGATLIFDGSIDYHEYYKDYKTRFSLLASFGNYSETSQIGPTFRFKDVNAFELTGESYYGIPYFTETGDNVHITAKIEEFNPNTGIFELSPIIVKGR